MSFRKSSYLQDPMEASGTFTGSFVGDGSDLTGVAGGGGGDGAGGAFELPNAYFNDATANGNNIRLADTAVIPSASLNVYTMETWIRPIVYTAFASPFAFGTGGDQFLWHLNSSGIQDMFDGGGVVTGQHVCPRNAWTHIALAVTGTNWELYFNGLLEASGVGQTAITPANGRRIAGDGGTEQMHGFLSDLRFWTVKRTAAQISSSFEKRLVGDEVGLAGYWKLDEDPSSSIAFNSAAVSQSDSGSREAGNANNTGSLFIPNIGPPALASTGSGGTTTGSFTGSFTGAFQQTEPQSGSFTGTFLETEFTPPTASISGTFVTQSIVGWYKSDVGVTTAVSGVSRWEDQSGHGNHMTQSTTGGIGTAAEPAFIDLSGSAFNKLPAIRFDGADDYLIATLSVDLTGSGLVPHNPGITFGATFRQLNNPEAFAGILSFGRTGVADFSNANTLAFTLANNETQMQTDRNNTSFAFKKYRNRAPTVVVITMDGSDIDIYQARRHDTFGDSESSLGVQYIIAGARKSNVTDPIVVFNNIEFAEIIVYDTALNPGEADALVEYLLSRAGIGN